MVNIHVDSYFIACPEIKEGKTAFENYAKSLLQWKDAQKEECIVFFFNKCSTETLLLTNKYPFWDDLRNCIKTFSIDYIQDKDLNVLAEALLNKSRKIEVDLELTDVLFDKIRLTPNSVVLDRTEAYKMDFLNTLSLMALMTFVKNEPSDKSFMLTKNFNEKESLLCINSSLEIFEPENSIEITKLPHLLESNFILIDDFNSLINKINIPLLVVSSKMEEKLFRFAIQVSTYRNGLEAGVIKKWEDLPKWRFGKLFIETTHELGFFIEEKKVKAIIKTITDILLNIDLRSTHALRAGKSGSSPQIEKGDYLAFRKDIDYEYHIHYWKSGNFVELASVVVHNEMRIS